MRYPTQHHGFTLIEISIVLVIIGLLAGGILKGQKMIENAKYKAWVNQIGELTVAVNMFKDRYGAFPGDMRNASSVLPPLPDGLPTQNGDGNGLISNVLGCTAIAVNCEGNFSIQHLLQAGLIKGDLVLLSQINTPVGGTLAGIRHVNVVAGRPRTIHASFYNIPSHLGKRLDEERDDGNPESGNVVCWECDTVWLDSSQMVSVFVSL